MAIHNEIGQKGEHESVNFLLANNYQIITTNYRFDKAEIDIIAKKEATLVFVEVKTRSNNYYGYPEDFVSEAQQKRIVKAAQNYIEVNHLNLNIRFDIIAIINQKEIIHFKDAFYPID